MTQFTCGDCGKVYTVDSEYVAPHTKPVGFGAEGYVYKISADGKLVERPASAEKWVDKDGKEVAKGTKGAKLVLAQNAAYFCKVCGEFVDGGTVKAFGGHTVTTAVTEKGFAPTCETTGRKDNYYKCDVCDAYILKDGTSAVITATGHDYVKVAGKKATCTEDGVTEHYTCANEGCKKVFTYDAKTKKYVEYTGELVIAATGHKAVLWDASENDCTKTAYKYNYCSACKAEWVEGYKCSVCDKLFDKDKKETTEEALVIKAKGHTEVVDPAVAATCETAGKTEGKHCSACKKVLVEQKEVPAKGHTIVKDPAVEESCTTDGKTAGSHCSVCKKVIVAQKRIPATGHNPGPEATCTEPQKCKTCGKNLGQAKGHIPGAAATCTEGQKCTVCGKEIAPAKGHTYGPGASCTEAQKCVVCGAELAPMKSHTPGAAATCTEAQKCTVCGTELAPAKGHTPGAAATCVKAQKCTVCGAEIAPATGKHTPGAAATCTEAQKCTVCGKELAPAKGHTPVVDAEVKPTLSKEGKTEGSHCSVCGEVIIAQQVIAKKSALWIYITVGVVVVIGAAVVVAVIVAKKRKTTDFN